MLSLEVRGQQELVERLRSLPAPVQTALRVKILALAIKLQTHVVTDKLHGQVLNQRSGALARSIQQDVTESGSAIYGRVFSAGDVKYAAIHEYGGRTPAHDIVPKKGEALAFTIGGKQVFAKVVHHPGSQMPERSFLRSSLADMADEITAGIKQAALDGARQALGEAAA